MLVLLTLTCARKQTCRNKHRCSKQLDKWGGEGGSRCATMGLSKQTDAITMRFLYILLAHCESVQIDWITIGAFWPSVGTVVTGILSDKEAIFNWNHLCFPTVRI